MKRKLTKKTLKKTPPMKTNWMKMRRIKRKIKFSFFSFQYLFLLSFGIFFLCLKGVDFSLLLQEDERDIAIRNFKNEIKEWKDQVLDLICYDFILFFSHFFHDLSELVFESKGGDAKPTEEYRSGNKCHSGIWD